jgi:hypothetical protein
MERFITTTVALGARRVTSMIGLVFIAALLAFDGLVYRRIGNPYR